MPGWLGHGQALVPRHPAPGIASLRGLDHIASAPVLPTAADQAPSRCLYAWCYRRSHDFQAAVTDLGAVHSQRRDWWRELSSTLAETRSHTERRTQLRSHLTAAPQTIWTSWAVARQRRIRHVGDHHTP